MRLPCPLPRVVHPFEAPAAIAGKAIVWLDVPWAEHAAEGEESANGLYSSVVEVDALQSFIAALRRAAV